MSENEKTNLDATTNSKAVELAEPDGIIVDENDVRGLNAAALQDADLVVLKSDVLVKFFAEGSKRPSYRILHAAGSVVSKAALRGLKGVKSESVEGRTAVHADTPAAGETDEERKQFEEKNVATGKSGTARRRGNY